MTHIPDEAVQAALDVCDKVDWVPALAGTGLCGREVVVSALTAAYPHLSAPCAVEVKKLEWTEHANLWHCDKNPEYQITRWWLDEIRKQGACFEVLEIGERQLGTLEEAKAAAQADFEHRILSSIVTKPVDVAAVREEGFQDAVKQAASIADDYIQYDVAKSIRVLSAAPTSEAGQ